MKKVFDIASWELHKLLNNWKKAVAIFLLPAALMMGALNLFPMLVNYLTTGNFGNHTIYVINSPDSFTNYVNSIDGKSVYKFHYVSSDEVLALDDDDLVTLLKKGYIFVEFSSYDTELSFDDSIRNYYSELSNGNSDAISYSTIGIGYNMDSPGMDTKAEQFSETILEPYKDYLLDELGGDYRYQGASLITTNEFNPVGKTLDYRTAANRGASRVIPALIVLLMYYCTYSLVSDIFAAEKERGFYNKLILTPVSRKHIFIGKLMAISGIVIASAVITFFMMFLSSWLNRSNDAMSLLPFGMLLTPYQLLLMFAEIIPAAILMGTVTMNIVFNSEKMQDTIMFLQFPLVLFLVDFFIQMFRWSRPLTFEMFVPLHNTIQILRDVFMSEDHWWRAIIPLTVNLIVAIVVFRKTLRKELTK